MPSQRILLVHLISNGDCLMATTVARQIKKDFPGCHLTWAIGYKCRQVIENNPDVDEIWSVDYAPNEYASDVVWHRTKAKAEEQRRQGQFDRIFYTQIFPENFNLFDGTTRTSIFRSYPGKITVPVAPILHLRPEEVERVREFVQQHGLANYRHVVLFECVPASSQSALNLESAVRIAHRVARERADTAFVISSHLRFRTEHPAVVDGSAISFRENAELSKYCSLLLGCSSGITWLLTSSWAKKLPTIQFLSYPELWYSFASVIYDHQHWGLDTSHIVESDLRDEQAITVLVNQCLAQDSVAGLPRSLFLPSPAQILDLVRHVEEQIDVDRVVANFVERNPAVAVDPTVFRSVISAFRMMLRLKRLGRRAMRSP